MSDTVPTGVVGHRQHNTEATSASLRFWARSIGDRNPCFVQEGYRSAIGGPGFRAHPCWLYSVQDTIVSVGRKGFRPVIAGSDWHFARAVRVGERLVSTVRLLSETPKRSRFGGDAFIQKVEVVYTDHLGVTVATCVSTLFRIAPGQARAQAKFQDWRRYRYTEAELIAIEADYDRETAGGTAPLHWDDVSDGDALPRIVRGPLSSEEIVLFVGATCPSPGGSAFTVARADGDDDAFIHPRTGTYESFAAGLIDDESARQMGFPAAHDLGIDRLSQAASLVTNWMGDTGVLHHLSISLLEPNMHGDTTWFEGTVVGRCRGSARTGTIEIELRGVNQRHAITVAGHARVELPLRHIATPPS